ncbi:fungal-specific transcription factor domain-containing protein [Thelonectria olida]|uniref:Fungal-specific transcription factor domain-containing protein n=1 Tax=Thelonectria olida TaxID=1576542 RepID=A0A9P8VSP7_9HYPO|nr:fungal-specific transcription factor domain-containing protein [Thelonectria olida]
MSQAESEMLAGPCRNCQAAHVECIYSRQERMLTVPEGYLKTLEAARDRTRRSRESHQPSLLANEVEGQSHPVNNSLKQQTVENSAAEAFLAKVNQLRQTATFSTISDHSSGVNGGSDDLAKSAGSSASTYEYFRLTFDTAHQPISLTLPPYPYAHHLLDQMEIYMGHDYHWFLWRNFRERLELTYKSPESQEVKDRLWLCRMLIVLSLGETFVNYHTPVIHLDPTSSPSNDGSSSGTPSPPGTTFFEQALTLLKLPFEEPSLEHIEILNLATFYSYSLNRKKTAYMYAGMSARMCNLLGLHQPSPRNCSILDQEHRKRVFWTSYCLDKMTSSELGLFPSLQPGQIKLDYPSNDELRPEDAGQFQEADFLRARIELTFMKAEADVSIESWQSIQDDVPDVERRVRPILFKLESWLKDLPPYMSFNCEAGMPESMSRTPTMRSLASLYLRCQQCFILLLRPLFLKRVTFFVSDEVDSASQDDNLKAFSDSCLRAARTNLSILISLWHHERVAKFGFWDSLHLFSSLTIFSLAISVNRWRPGSFDEKDIDAVTYSTAKTLLHDLVKAGNLASKGHEKMLQDVEALGEVFGAMQTEGSEMVLEQWDMDNWMAQVLSMDTMSMPLYGLEQG